MLLILFVAFALASCGPSDAVDTTTTEAPPGLTSQELARLKLSAVNELDAYIWSININAVTDEGIVILEDVRAISVQRILSAKDADSIAAVLSEGKVSYTAMYNELLTPGYGRYNRAVRERIISAGDELSAFYSEECDIRFFWILPEVVPEKFNELLSRFTYDEGANASERLDTVERVEELLAASKVELWQTYTEIYNFNGWTPVS